MIRNPNCTLCPLHEHAMTVCLMGKGPRNARVMLIGEAPGEVEDRQGEPFVGRAGELLDSVLYTVELPRDTVYITNTNKCRPQNNSKPSRKEIKICTHEYLVKEVARIKPELIVAMGAIAAEGILQEKVSVNQYRNRTWLTSPPFLPKIPVYVTYHPAAALRNEAAFFGPIVKDFERVVEFLNGDKEEEPEINYQRVHSRTLADRYEEAKKEGRVSIDIETEGLDAYVDGPEIVSVQTCSTPGQAFYYKWSDWVRTRIKPLLEDKDLIKITHFGKHEWKWFKRFGLSIKGKWRDISIMAHLLNENASKDLDDIASEHTPLRQHKVSMREYVKEHKCKWGEVPDNIAVPYGCGDVDAPIRLDTLFYPQIISRGLEPLFNLQMKGMRLFAEVERNGFCVDVDKIPEMKAKYEDIIESTQRKLDHLTERELNAGSHVQLKQLLYKEWDLPPLGQPKEWGGEPTYNTKKETLQMLLAEDLTKDQRRAILYVLELRKKSKLLSTYIVGLNKHIREGNKIHPSFNLVGTDTGRRSCSKPNLQNIPRGADIKRLFISRYGRDGCIVQVDLSQAELRYASAIGHEKTLASYFLSTDKDVHLEVTARLFGIPKEKVTEDQRFKGKTINFLILYGGSANKLYRQLDELGNRIFKSLDEATELRNAWHREFHGWPKHCDDVRKQIIEHGFVRNPFGRFRHLTVTDPHNKYAKEIYRKAVNAEIQSSVGEHALDAAVRVRARLIKHKIRRALMVNEVHDSGGFDCHKSVVKDVCEIIKEEYEQTDFRPSGFDFKLSVPMKADIKVGPNWGDLEDYQC